MANPDLKIRLPETDELPDSDGLPVDSELHTLISNLLHFVLGFIWADRFDKV